MADVTVMNLVSPGLFKAGQDFVAGIEALGLRPTAAFWLYDRASLELRLGLVTDVLAVFDYSEFHRLIVKAYERSALPHEIDPLMVETFERSSVFAREVRKAMPIIEGSPLVAVQTMTRQGEVRTYPASAGFSFTEIGPYIVSNSWVYRSDWRGRSNSDIQKEMKLFRRTVGELKAA